MPAPGGADRWVFRKEGKTVRARYAFVRGDLTRDPSVAAEAVRARGEALLAAQSAEAPNVVNLAAKKG